MDGSVLIDDSEGPWPPAEVVVQLWTGPAAPRPSPQPSDHHDSDAQLAYLDDVDRTTDQVLKDGVGIEDKIVGIVNICIC